jgi:hypothetical protein
MVRKAYRSLQGGESGAEKMTLIARLFANEVAQVTSQSLLKIILGSGEFDPKASADLLARLALAELNAGYQNTIRDMDRLADLVFER